MLSGSWATQYLTCPSMAACHQYTALWTWSTISWSEGCWRTIWESLLKTSWDRTTCRIRALMWESNRPHVDWPASLRVYCSLRYISMSTYNTFSIIFSRFCFILLCLLWWLFCLFCDLIVTLSPFLTPQCVLVCKLLLCLSSDGVKWRCVHQLVIPGRHDGCQSGALGQAQTHWPQSLISKVGLFYPFTVRVVS